MATIYPSSDENISFLSKKILGGELVAVPTETVYGLAADAFNAAACARIFEAKERPFFDPLIVHLPVDYDWTRICYPPPLLTVLAEAFWPGALTVVVRKKPSIPDIVTAGFDSVAIRVPNHPVFQQLLSRCKRPLAAPSANPFGYVSPTTAGHVQETLGEKISYILDGGPSQIGLESTIIDLRDPDQISLLRPGAIPKSDIEAVLGKNVQTLERKPERTETMPGQLERHYSPKTPAFLREKIESEEPLQHPSTAFLFYQKPLPLIEHLENVFWLSEKGDSVEAARRLFSRLHEIDRAGFKKLIAEKALNSGLGIAINDRLRRAAAR